jgi:hypothetical protein
MRVASRGLRLPLLTSPGLLLSARPFVGLDPPVALEIADLIREVARDGRVAFLLVSHMEQLAARLQPALTVHLLPRPPPAAGKIGTGRRRPVPLWRGQLSLASRLVHRFCDYFFYSLPLIVCAFVATGARAGRSMSPWPRARSSEGLPHVPVDWGRGGRDWLPVDL